MSYAAGEEGDTVIETQRRKITHTEPDLIVDLVVWGQGCSLLVMNFGFVHYFLHLCIFGVSVTFIVFSDTLLLC